MGLFETLRDAPRTYKRTDLFDWNGAYRGHTIEWGTEINAFSPTEGRIGWYDRLNDITFDARGIPVGKGNWLMSLFERP